MCEDCLDDEGKFCPKNLFYKDIVKFEGNELEVIRFKFKEVVKCQACLKCALSCPENAIKPVKFEA
jgi:ferredoxin